MEDVTTEEGSQPTPETTETGGQGDAFQTVIAILIAVVAVSGAIVAWRAALADAEAGNADFAGMRADINATETQIVNTTSLYENYRAYVEFTYQRKLGELLTEELEARAETEPSEELVRQTAIASQLASDNELFFSKRYLNQDGSYNRQRDLGEALAEAGETLDLNPEPHFAVADRLRSKSNLLIGVFIVQAVALLLYTVAEALHPSRNILRYSMAFGGTACLIFSIIAVLMIEWS